jgi:hypothetical protein
VCTILKNSLKICIVVLSYIVIYIVVGNNVYPSWEAHTRLSSQIPHLLWNLKVHIHKSCQLTLSWAKLIHFTFSRPISLRSHLRLGPPCGSFHQVYISFLRATCPAHLIFIYFITLIIFDEEYKLWRSLYKSLHHPVASSLLGFRYSPQHFAFTHTRSMLFPWAWDTKLHTHTQKTGKVTF